METFWKNKAQVSYFLAILVFFIHIPSIGQYLISEAGPTGNWISKVNQFANDFTYGILPPLAVPLFLILSGVAFFRNYTNDQYISKQKSRIKSLLIPYLFWNLVGMVFMVIMTALFREHMVLREPFEFSWKNVLLGIFYKKYNGHYWYIFDLMLFSVLAPVVDLILKKKYVFWIIWFAFAALFACKIIPYSSFIFRSDAVLYYLLGCYIGKYKLDIFSGFLNKKAKIIAVILFAICMSYFTLTALHIITVPQELEFPILSVYALSFWFVCTNFICPHLKMHDFYYDSFPLFTLHVMVGSCISKVLMILLPNPIFAIPNFILTVILTLLFVRIFCYLLDKYLPKVYSFIFGRPAKR